VQIAIDNTFVNACVKIRKWLSDSNGMHYVNQRRLAVNELSNGRVICVGGIVWETIFTVDKIPGKGVKLLPRDARQLASGMAVSAAASIARLGRSVELWGLLGDDATGQACLKDLAAEGIAVDHIQMLPDVTTPISTILVDPAGERLVVPYFDPLLYAQPTQLPLSRIKSAAAVLADVRWVEGSEAALRCAREHGVPGILDADFAPRHVLERLLPLADHVLFSEIALLSLVKEKSPQAALREIALTLKQAKVVGVTLGEHGTLIWEHESPDVILHFPAHKIRAVDTLNAGDIWHGAYVYGLVTNLATAECVRLANVAAAIKCERAGGRLGAPYLNEVLSRLESVPPEGRPLSAAELT
jgi:sulfofructose kinase